MKYTYNSDIFLKENDISYYLLGAFLTDGCMKKNCVSLSSKDKDWLETIRNILCKELPLKKDGNNCFRISICDMKIRQWLLNHNCIPKKSLTLEMPKIPKNYLADFLRGCIDGDGSISHKQYERNRNKNKVPYKFYSTHYALTTASKNFANSFVRILRSNNLDCAILESKPGSKKSIIDGRDIIHKNTHYTITGGHNSAFKFLNWIYYPGHQLSMMRKKNIANDIINFYSS